MSVSVDRVTTLLGQVRLYAEAGLHVLPIHGTIGGQCTCGKTDCKDVGKHPIFPTGVYSASTDYEWLTEVYEERPAANVAIAAGRISGLILLDLDSQNAIDQARQMGLPVTWTFRTGRGEQHAFAYPSLQENFYIQSDVSMLPGMDIRADGGYSVVPPSMHYTGKTYEWVQPFGDVPLAAIPKWIYDKLIIKNRTASPTFEQAEHTEIQEEGGRNDYLFKLGSALRANKLSGEEIRLVLLERNIRSCSPPLSEEEVSEIAASISQRYAPGIVDEMSDRVREKLGDLEDLPQILLTAKLTDSGNAECLVDLFAKDFRACKAVTKNKAESKGVFFWNGSIWVEDVGRVLRDCAKWTARGRQQIANHAETVEARRKLYVYATQSENIGKLEAMCELASTNDEVKVHESVWDAEPLKLSVRNGTIDLQTGVFAEPSREDYITKQASVDYVEDAICPIWEKTLSQIFRDHVDVIPYLQRVFGYCLTGLTDEHLVWFWYGDGANGKSTILNTVKAVLGDFAATTAFSTFDTKNENGRNDGLAELRGKRFVAASEGEQGRTIAEAKIKAVASSDPISCRFLFNNLFTYTPTYKIILASNYLPEIKGTDKGIWRRVNIIQFNQTFEGDVRDPHLDEKLEGELSGILNWCLAGLQDYWERGGFDPPRSVLYSTQKLEHESDFFQQWYDERLTPSSGDSIRRQVAYLDYRTYARTSGELAISKQMWVKRCSEYGIDFSAKVRGDYSARGWKLESDVY